MNSGIFEKWVVGGGWAMFLLIPAAVVALATFLRGMLLLRGYGASHGDPAMQEPDYDAGTIRPLLWVYALAPLVGAAGTLTRLVNGTEGKGAGGNVLYVPMLWGVAIALFAGLVYYGLRLRGRRSRGPGTPAGGALMLPGLVALVAALVICGFGHSVVQKQGQNRNQPAEPTLHVKRGSFGNETPHDVPALEVTDSGYRVDGQVVATEDILFRLTAMAARTEAIIIKVPGDLTANRMAEALALVNQAGFVQVGIDAQQTDQD